MTGGRTARLYTGGHPEFFLRMLSQKGRIQCKYTRGRGTRHGDEIHGIHAGWQTQDDL